MSIMTSVLTATNLGLLLFVIAAVCFFGTVGYVMHSRLRKELMVQREKVREVAAAAGSIAEMMRPCPAETWPHIDIDEHIKEDQEESEDEDEEEESDEEEEEEEAEEAEGSEQEIVVDALVPVEEDPVEVHVVFDAPTAPVRGVQELRADLVKRGGVTATEAKKMNKAAVVAALQGE
jgi:hypothetical protein